MVGLFRRISDRRPTLGQAWERATGLFLVSALLIVLGWFVAQTPAAAQESAACEQYDCAEEKALAFSSPPPPGSTTAHAGPTSASGRYEEVVTAHQEPVPIAGGPPSAYRQPEGHPAPEPTADGNIGRESAAEEPLPGYPYAGEPCEEGNCGLEGIEHPVRCATYETTSGQRVFGCANPYAYEREGCYEVTFYTETGEPYANLDTCSGEKPYAPPEPPEGRFRYWDPPDTPREPVYGTWPHWDQCQKASGAIDHHCGLQGLPAPWVCAVFYDTVHGTVRGCYDERRTLEHDSYCIEELYLYDEAGKPLGTYRLCPEVDVESCAEDRCATQGVPDGWVCRTEEWDYGELYGSERRLYTRCADPLAEEYLSGEIQPRPDKMCVYLFDERGRTIEAVRCAPGQGDSQVGFLAGQEAEEAVATLNDHDSLALPSGGWFPSARGSETAPGERAELVGAVVDALTELLAGRRSSADPKTPASVVTTEVGSDAPDNVPAGNELLGVQNKNAGADAGGATGSSAVHRAVRSGTLEAGGSDVWSARSDERSGADAEGLRWKISGAVRVEAARVVRGGVADGWLEIAAGLAGLGAVGGAFGLRRRFLG